MGINNWPESERPREKLLNRGADNLSDAELLAIFLRTGIKGKSAVDLARELLISFGSLRALLTADKEEFCQHLGLGPAKYAQLQAVLEMARRHFEEQLHRSNALTSPEITQQYLQSKLRDLRSEEHTSELQSRPHLVCRLL